MDSVTVRRGDDLFTVEYAGSVFDAVEKFASGASPDEYPELTMSNVVSAGEAENLKATKASEGWKEAGLRERYTEAQTVAAGYAGDSAATLGMTPACCLNTKKPCKHWIWDGVQQGYVNSLTGEIREAGVM